MQPQAWNPTLMFIKDKVEQIAEHNFTTVLANLYRNENDSNGWQRSKGDEGILVPTSKCSVASYLGSCK